LRLPTDSIFATVSESIDVHGPPIGREKYKRGVSHNLMKLLLALLSSLVIAPLSFGTIIVVEFTDNGVIVAADSRETTDSGLNDHACKITELDRSTFFFADGTPVGKNDPLTGRPIWNTVELSRSAFATSIVIRDHFSLIRTAANWAALMQEKIDASLEDVIKANPAGLLSQGVFGGAGNEGLRMYLVTFKYALPPSVLRAETFFVTQQLRPGVDPPVVPFGDSSVFDLIAEFLRDETDRSKALNVMFRNTFAPTSQDYEARRIQSAIKAAIEWASAKTIGGNVDVMVLDFTNGIRWIERKTECGDPSKQQKH
jgi:hypothetical protein